MHTWQRLSRGLAVLLTGALIVLLSPAVQSEAPLPVVPEGKGEQCVEPTEDMRRNHMNYLMHHRDKTMREGVRTKQHSLKECIYCHATEVPKDVHKDFRQTMDCDSCHLPPPNTVLGSGGFCESCHKYAGVTMDCWQCHWAHTDRTE